MAVALVYHGWCQCFLVVYVWFVLLHYAAQSARLVEQVPIYWLFADDFYAGLFALWLCGLYHMLHLCAAHVPSYSCRLKDRGYN